MNLKSSSKKPLISIIVPVYNVEDYLEQCLESLIKQSYENIEIICINDGSTDSSAEILSTFRNIDKRITIITTRNHGQAHARNIGINCATGQYITFVDSDDWLDYNALKVCLSIRMRNNCDIICFGINQIKNGVSMPFKSYKELICNTSVTKSLAISISPEVAGKLYNSSFLKNNNIKFPEGLIYEDMTFYWTCISYSKSISLINHSLYNYRIRNDSTMGKSKQRTKNYAIHHLYNLKIIFYTWENNHFLDSNIDLFLFILESSVQQSYKFLHKDDREEFQKELTSLCKEINIAPPALSLANFILKNKRPIKPLHKIVRSVLKRRLS